MKRLHRLVLCSFVSCAAVCAQQGAKPAARGLHPALLALSRPAVRSAAPVLPASGGVQVAALESEPNDTNARPDSMVGASEFDGTLAATGDVDIVRFDLAQDSMVSLRVVARGNTPAPDPFLILADAGNQWITMSDDSVGLYPWIGVALPAGSYRATIATFLQAGGGDYRLTMVAQATTIPVLPANQMVNGSCNGNTGGIETYRFVLPVASAVSLAATSATLDLNLAIGRAAGGEITWLDDTAASTDPRIDTHLRAGTYCVRVADIGFGSGPFTLRLTTTAAEPQLGCAGPVAANLLGVESQPVWKVTLAAPASVLWSTSAGSAPAVRDTLLRVLDADYAPLLYNDDHGLSTLSKTGGSLPAGTYYVMVTAGLGDAGSVGLSMQCSNPGAVAGDFGQNLVGPLPTDGLGLTLTLEIGTPSPLDVRLATTASGLGLFTVVDDSGRVTHLASMFTPPDVVGGAPVAAGRVHVLVHDFDNSPSVFDVSIRPQIWFRNRGTDRTLLVTDHAGRQLHLFASAALLPAPIPLPAPLQGNLLIDLAAHVYLGMQPLPVTGTLTWPLVFQPYPVALQGLSVDSSPFAAAMTQAVR